MVKNKPLLRSTPIKEKVSAKLILKMLEEAEEHHAEQYYDNQRWKSHNRRIL